jgi:hypothetical protein
MYVAERSVCKIMFGLWTSDTYLINSEVLNHQCLWLFVSHKSNMIHFRQNFIPDGKVLGLAQWDGLGVSRTSVSLWFPFFFLQQSNKNRKENPVKISRTMYQPRAPYLIWTVRICVRSENRKCKLYWEMLPALWKKKQTHLKTQKEYSFRYMLYLKHLESYFVQRLEFEDCKSHVKVLK